MRITPDEVRQVAALARLSFSAEELDELTQHFDTILTYVDKLGELQTDSVEPTAHAVAVSAPLRDDVVTNTPSAAQTDALLANAPSRKTHFFRVPKIIE